MTPSSPSSPGSRWAVGTQASRDSGKWLMETGDLQPWTAARCHHLLWQLESHLASLRGLASDAEALRLHPAKRSSSTSDLKNEPSRPFKRIRHTYSRKKPQPSIAVPSPMTPPRVVRTLGAMKRGRSPPACGQVDFPTPIWQKIRHQSFATPTPPTRSTSAAWRTRAAAAIPGQLTVELRALRSTISGGQFRIYEHIFNWLNSLLMATGSGTHDLRGKSLLSMCLRRVPACIRDIEAWDRQESNQKGVHATWYLPDMTLELYSQLEAFGPKGGGWNPLRVVVHSHAIALLSEAISEAMFEPPFVELLAKLCTHLGCAEEAAKLVLSVESPLPGPASSHSGFDESKRLRPLSSMVNATGCKAMTGYGFNYLSHMLRDGRLPVEWLSTRGFRGVWYASLEAATAARPMPSVTEFLSLAVDRLAFSCDKDGRGTGGNPVKTLRGITAGVAAAALALRAQGASGNGAARRKQAERRLVYILDSAVAQNLRRRRRDGTYGGNGLLILLMARYLATAAAGPGKSNESNVRTLDRLGWIEELTGLFERAETDANALYEQTIFLTCAIARCCGRASSVCSHRSVDGLCSLLEKMALPRWFSNGLRTDVAFSLAQTTRDLRDLAFAERIPTSRLTTTAFSGWRWEEGISEWVLPSPGAVKPGAANMHGSIDGGGCRTRGLGHEEKHGRGPRLSSLRRGDGGRRDGRGRESGIRTGPRAGSYDHETEQQDRTGGSNGKSGAIEKGIQVATRRRLRAQPSQAPVVDDDWDELQVVIG